VNTTVYSATIWVAARSDQSVVTLHCVGSESVVEASAINACRSLTYPGFPALNPDDRAGSATCRRQGFSMQWKPLGNLEMPPRLDLFRTGDVVSAR
jgi:hypothetical protein